MDGAQWLTIFVDTHYMQPVTVVATVLNEARDIPRLVDSLLAQTPPTDEIIIVDGGSTDGTWEWLQQTARTHPALLAVRAETCSLRYTPGPVAKGRNLAIAAATHLVIACADAGCAYRPDWLAQLTAPLVQGEAKYALGGSCLDMSDPTVWDLASAPFFGVKLSLVAPNKSCTARSMAFTKELWRQIGGFPESVLLGEDTLFDLEARKRTAPAFAPARALYRPQNTFCSACKQMARYAISDGILGVRRSRLTRNVARCVAGIAALGLLHWTWVPLALVLALEIYIAFRLDWLFPRTLRPHVLAARLAFSLIVPWIVTINHIRGSATRENPTNAQNNREADQGSTAAPGGRG